MLCGSRPRDVVYSRSESTVRFLYVESSYDVLLSLNNNRVKHYKDMSVRSFNRWPGFKHMA
jgi:hypothetical protein